MPVIELTIQQEFHLRRITDLLPQAQKDDIITIFLALQKQNFCLANTIKNLLKEWPLPPHTTPEEKSNFGILFETKDSPTT